MKVLYLNLFGFKPSKFEESIKLQNHRIFEKLGIEEETLSENDSLVQKAISEIQEVCPNKFKMFVESDVKAFAASLVRLFMLKNMEDTLYIDEDFLVNEDEIKCLLTTSQFKAYIYEESPQNFIGQLCAIFTGKGNQNILSAMIDAYMQDDSWTLDPDVFKYAQQVCGKFDYSNIISGDEHFAFCPPFNTEIQAIFDNSFDYSLFTSSENYKIIHTNNKHQKIQFLQNQKENVWVFYMPDEIQTKDVIDYWNTKYYGRHCSFKEKTLWKKL